MPAAHGVAKSGATCLACIPLRMGVFIAAIGTTVGSFAAIHMKQNYPTFARMFFGGYGGYSPLFGKLVDYVGIVWGLWGVIGCWQMKEGFLQIYNYYNMLRVITWMYVLYTDFPLIWNCEEW